MKVSLEILERTFQGMNPADAIRVSEVVGESEYPDIRAVVDVVRVGAKDVLDVFVASLMGVCYGDEFADAYRFSDGGKMMNERSDISGAVGFATPESYFPSVDASVINFQLQSPTASGDSTSSEIGEDGTSLVKNDISIPEMIPHLKFEDVYAFLHHVQEVFSNSGYADINTYFDKDFDAKLIDVVGFVFDKIDVARKKAISVTSPHFANVMFNSFDEDEDVNPFDVDPDQGTQRCVVSEREIEKSNGTDVVVRCEVVVVPAKTQMRGVESPEGISGVSSKYTFALFGDIAYSRSDGKSDQPEYGTYGTGSKGYMITPPGVKEGYFRQTTTFVGINVTITPKERVYAS